MSSFGCENNSLKGGYILPPPPLKVRLMVFLNLEFRDGPDMRL